MWKNCRCNCCRRHTPAVELDEAGQLFARSSACGSSVNYTYLWFNGMDFLDFLESPPHAIARWYLEKRAHRRAVKHLSEPPAADGGTFRYTPLSPKNDEIRLLTLLPGEEGSDVRIVIRNTCFINYLERSYEALSYTWGHPEDRARVLVGRSGDTYVSVTKNLLEVLPYLRYRHRPRQLWVDAICINQADADERSQQVAIMAVIYRRATAVIAWLGPATCESDFGMSCLETLGAKVEADWHTGTMRSRTSEAHWSDGTKVLPFSKRELMALFAVLDRPWWARLWIYQEIRLCTHKAVLKCGLRELPWSAVSDAVFCILNKPSAIELLSPENVPDLPSAAELCDVKWYNILDLLDISSGRQCLDPRDKVYALLSVLVPVDLALGLRADYNKSVADVYHDLAVRHVTKSEQLEILIHVRRPQKVAGLPSWVPDWTVQDGVHGVQIRGSASSYTRLRKPRYTREALHVRGQLVGRIQYAQRMRAYDLYSALRVVAVQMAEDLQAFAAGARILEQIRTDGRFTQMLCRVLCRGNLMELDLPFDPRDRSSKLDRLKMTRNLCLETPAYQHHVEQPSVDEYTVRLFANHLGDQNLFITDDGNLGLGPSAIQIGDQVSVLLGCNTAIVLRSDDDMSFKVVGPAYLDGVMDGEALLGPLPDNVEAVREWDPKTRTADKGFRNRETGIVQCEDPRLGPLPTGWRRSKKKPQGAFWMIFENDDTGETRVAWEDPRCDEEVLIDRGIQLRSFELV